MDPEDQEELEALVVGFLQQSLSQYPNGLTLQEFERSFPDKMDETHDWYRRYKKKTTLEALECVQKSVKLSYNNRFNSTTIALNRQSDKVDAHLVDLITHQRAPSKKKRGFSRPSTRALASFNLNRKFSSYNSRPSAFKSRINHDQQYRNENSFVKRVSPPANSHFERPSFRPSIYNKSISSPSSRMAAADPRNRSSMVPPQIRPASVTSQSSLPKSKDTTPVVRPLQSASIPKPPARPVTSESAKPKPPAEVEDPIIFRKKDQLRQRIVSLLTTKLPEIKLLHLNGIYRITYDEQIDPIQLGHKNLTSLIQDPVLSDYIQINYTSGFVTISVRDRIKINGKDNTSSNDTSRRASTAESNGINGYSNTNGQSSIQSSAKSKMNVIDPFNVRTMLQTLEPIGAIKEPPVNNLEIEEIIKYKTMRMIFKSPDNSTLKLDDWEHLYESEHRCKIRIRDYGFKTLLDFFRKLETELPIKIDQRNGQWVAIADIPSLSRWVEDKLSKGHHRAVLAVDREYEKVVFPDEVYTYAQNVEDLKSLEFQPVFILSVKLPSSLWVQLRTPARIEAHLCVETAMTCYEDYKEKNLFKVHLSFIKPGFPCAVFDNSQKRWCRALVLEVPDKVDKNHEVLALLVDYATTRKYPVSQLLYLLKPHFKYPVGPIYSRLHGVQNECSIEVQKRVKITLHEFTSPPVTLACKFNRVVPSTDPAYLPQNCLEITLYDTRHGRDCNLTDAINLSRNQDGDN